MTGDSPVPTTDPVGVTDIAHRIGLPYSRVRGWHNRGYLGEPQYRIEAGPLWAWEVVKGVEYVRRALGLWSAIDLAWQAPELDVYWEAHVPQESWSVVGRRLRANERGWVSWPSVSEDGEKIRVLLTDSTEEQRVGAVYGRQAFLDRCRQLDEGLVELFRDNDTRTPSLGGTWVANGK